MQRNRNTGAWFAGISLLVSSAVIADVPLLSVERPREGDKFSGVVEFRGWSLAADGIDYIEVFVDNVSFGRLGYGGARPDVTAAKPGFPDTANPGLSGAFNVNRLQSGNHVVRIVAHDLMGHTQTITRNVSSYRFGDRKLVKARPDSESMVANGTSQIGLEDFRLYRVSIEDVGADWEDFEVWLSWNEQIQNFEITKIFDGEIFDFPLNLGPPTGLLAAKNINSVDLTWTDNSGVEVGYYVDRRYVPFGFPITPSPWERIAILDPETEAFTDDNVKLTAIAPGDWQYHVIAFSFENQSEPSNIVQVSQSSP